MELPEYLNTLSPKITDMNFNNRNSTSEIPYMISHFSNLVNINLFNNQITGEIPNSISLLTNLKTLNLYNNQITGNIPKEISTLSKLQLFQVYNNQLHGKIPSTISCLTNLQSLNISNNKLSGKIPSSISKLKNLKYLLVNNNKLCGDVPESLSLLSKLIQINISFNYFNPNLSENLKSKKNLRIELTNAFQIPSNTKDIWIHYITKPFSQYSKLNIENNNIKQTWTIDDITMICSVNNLLSKKKKYKEIDLCNINELSCILENNNNINTWNELYKFINEKKEINNNRITKKENKLKLYKTQHDNIINKRKILQNQLKQLQEEEIQLENKTKQITKQLEEMKIPTQVLFDASKHTKEAVEKHIKIEEQIDNMRIKTNNFSKGTLNNNDITILLKKMNLIQYTNLFLSNMNVFKDISSINEELLYEDCGMKLRDSCCFLYNLELLKLKDYKIDENCICIHNTINKTIELLQEWNINIKDDIIRKNNWTTPLIIQTNRLVDTFNLKSLSIEEKRKIRLKLLEWRIIHLKHLTKI